MSLEVHVCITYDDDDDNDDHERSLIAFTYLLPYFLPASSSSFYKFLI